MATVSIELSRTDFKRPLTFTSLQPERMGRCTLHVLTVLYASVQKIPPGSPEKKTLEMKLDYLSLEYMIK